MRKFLPMFSFVTTMLLAGFMAFSSQAAMAASARQLAKLTSSDGQQYGDFGYSVAISGNTIVVGAPEETINGNQSQGAVYVFVKPPSGWGNMTQTARLTASNGAAFDRFGVSVAISGDTVAVGAPQTARDGGFVAGSVYVFVQPQGGWHDMTQTAELNTSDEGAGTYFGGSVAIRGDTVVSTGAFGENGPGTGYVFVQPPTGWTNSTQTARLYASNGNIGPIDIDGNTVIGGAAAFQKWKGGAYVFVEPPNGWQDTSETAVLTASDGKANDDFGWSVAIRGNSLIVGASQLGNNGCSDCGPGKAYIFTKSPNGWVTGMPFTAELGVKGAPSGFAVGYSVGFTGPVAILGSWPAHYGSPQNEGLVFAFLKPNSGWHSSPKASAILGPSDPVKNDNFGLSVGIDATTAVVGANGALVNGAVTGAAYVFGK